VLHCLQERHRRRQQWREEQQKSGAKTKTADELLAKKKKQTVSPKYKGYKTTGKTKEERQKITRQGEKALRDLRLKNLGKKSESELKHPITKYRSKYKDKNNTN